MRLDSDSKPNLRVDESSVPAEFSRFTLNLNLVADHWALSTTPTDAPVEVKIQLPGYWYGGGELINQHHPLDKSMLHSAPFYTFDNGRESPLEIRKSKHRTGSLWISTN